MCAFKKQKRWRSAFLTAVLAMGAVGIESVLAAEQKPAKPEAVSPGKVKAQARPPGAARSAPVAAPTPVLPATTESPGVAFRRLANGKGYVEVDDVEPLQGFSLIFETADEDNDGRLNPREFDTAWKAYIASSKANVG